MALPLNGNRHRQWNSNTNITIFIGVIVWITYLTWSGFGVPPAQLQVLAGMSSAAVFGALGDDKRKKDQDVEVTAHQALDKADKLIEESAARGEGPNNAAE